MLGGLHPPPSVYSTWKLNYVDPETRGWALPASLIALYFVALFAVVFRLLGRLVYMHNAGIDDLFICIALVINPSVPSFMPTLTVSQIFLTGFIFTIVAC